MLGLVRIALIFLLGLFCLNLVFHSFLLVPVPVLNISLGIPQAHAQTTEADLEKALALAQQDAASDVQNAPQALAPQAAPQPAQPQAGVTANAAANPPKPLAATARSIPVSALPVATDAGMTSATTPLTAPTAAPVTVLSAAMSAADLAAHGILNQDNGGFDGKLWDGITRTQADLLLARIRTHGLQSPTARRLLQRALLTEATPPQGSGDGAGWLAARAQTLQAMGAADAARELLEAVTPDELADDSVAQAWVNDKLLTGNTKQACDFVSQRVLNSDLPYWHKAMLVCQALSGNPESLKLTLGLVSAQERSDTPLLYDLLDAVRSNGQSPRLAPDTQFTPLEAVLYMANPRLVNPEVILHLPDTALRALVADKRPASTISIKLQAAEKLVNDFGAPSDVASLVALYNQVNFNDADLANALKGAQAQADGSLARALLWQGAGAAHLPSGKALALKALWARAENDGLADLAGSLTPALRGIQPDPNLAWFSPYVIRAALRSGNLPVAQAWWQVLQSNQTLSRDLTLQRTDLSLAFAMLSGDLPADTLQGWLDSQNPTTEQGRAKIVRILALMESLDLPVSADAWLDLLGHFDDAQVKRGMGPGPIWLRVVGSSIEAGHEGQSILLLVEPLMYTPPSAMDPQGVANIVAGLKYVGLKEDATSLALEAVLHDNKVVF